MTCEELQNVLASIIDWKPSAQAQAHLDSCRICRNLVADLKHIAQSAKFLLHLDEPPERVWDKIRCMLESQRFEGASHKAS